MRDSAMSLRTSSNVRWLSIKSMNDAAPVAYACREPLSTCSDLGRMTSEKICACRSALRIAKSAATNAAARSFLACRSIASDDCIIARASRICALMIGMVEGSVIAAPTNCSIDPVNPADGLISGKYASFAS